MNNKELGKFIASEDFKESANSLVRNTEEIIGAGADLVTTTFFGLPSYSFLKPFIENLKNWRSRVELKQLAFYLKEFENLNQSERSDFSLMIQGNEEDFTERIFYYISQLNDKKKASLCGKLGVSYARKFITSEMFLRLIQIIQRSNFQDLDLLKTKLENAISDDDFGNTFDQIEHFITPSAFKITFNSADKILISELINLGLVTMEVDSKSINNAQKAIGKNGIDRDKLAKSFRDFKVRHCFTESAFFLYHQGLAKLKN